jgi:hypothetical protein
MAAERMATSGMVDQLSQGVPACAPPRAMQSMKRVDFISEMIPHGSKNCAIHAALFRYPHPMETFDLQQTAKLAALAPTPPPQRDQAWCDSVLHAVPNASLASFNPQIQNGPDTFPYFQLAIPDAGPFTPFSIVHLLDHLLQAGAGVVIHANLRRD